MYKEDTLKAMYLGNPEDGTYEYIGEYTDGLAAAWAMHRKGYEVEELQYRGIYTEDECVFDETNNLD